MPDGMQEFRTRLHVVNELARVALGDDMFVAAPAFTHQQLQLPGSNQPRSSCIGPALPEPDAIRMEPVE